MLLSQEQCQCFDEEGYLILQDVLSSEETGNLQSWAQEVHDWPTAEDSPWMPYEVFTKTAAEPCKAKNALGNQYSRPEGAVPNRKLCGLSSRLQRAPSWAQAFEYTQSTFR